MALTSWDGRRRWSSSRWGLVHNTRGPSGELSVGDVIEIRSGAITHWLACDPHGWRPITEPVNRDGAPLSAATVYRHLNARRTTR